MKGANQDDKLDALAMAVDYFMDAMRRDEEEAYKAHKDELVDQMLEEFMEGTGARRNRFKDSVLNSTALSKYQ